MVVFDIVGYQWPAQELFGVPANNLPAIRTIFPVQLVGVYIVGILVGET